MTRGSWKGKTDGNLAKTEQRKVNEDVANVNNSHASV